MNVVSAQNFTDHELFARIITEWNLSCVLSLDYPWTIWTGRPWKKSKYRAVRMREIELYTKLVMQEAEAMACTP